MSNNLPVQTSIPFYKDPQFYAKLAIGAVTTGLTVTAYYFRQRIRTSEEKKRLNNKLNFEREMALLKDDSKGLRNVNGVTIETLSQFMEERKKVDILNRLPAENVYDCKEITSADEKIDTPKRVKDMNGRSAVESEYILGKFFEKGEISILCGRTNTGKTYALYHILYGIADGKSSGLFDGALENDDKEPNQVIAYLGESSETDICNRFADHPNLRIFSKEQCAELNQDIDKLVTSIRKQVAQLANGTNCTIGLDNMAKLCDESSNWTNVDKLCNGLENVISEAKKRDITVSVILIVHTNTDSKRPSLKNFKGLQNKINLCKNILEIYPCGLGKEYKMLVPLKCKYDNTLEEKAFVIKQRKSNDKPQVLFEFVKSMILDEALNLERKDDAETEVEVKDEEILIDEKKRRGRPRRTSDDTIKMISEDVKNGMSESAACLKHNLPRSTYKSRISGN